MCAWARDALLRARDRYSAAANRRRTPPPEYQLSQMVWLSTRDLPLRGDSRKLAPKFVGPFPIITVISPSAVKLRLPCSLRVHPTFNVSRTKPMHDSPVSPATRHHLHPSWWREAQCTQCAASLVPAVGVEACSTWSIGKVTARRTDLGSGLRPVAPGATCLSGPGSAPTMWDLQGGTGGRALGR